MRALSISIISILILSVSSIAQPSALWSQTFGGSGTDGGFSVQQTSDGGYIIGGSTESSGAGGSDVYLIKTDASGSEQWTQTFGGSSGDYGESVQQTSDGGYIITGYTLSFGAGEIDVYLIKTDASGIEQWSQTFGGSGDVYGYSVQQTIDGGYIIAGYTEITFFNTDFYLIKADASGNLLWSRTFGGSETDKGYSVQQTDDGGYVIAGRTSSYGAGSYDVYLVKTNASGDTLLTRTFGGSSSDFGSSVHQTDDGGYIIAGYTYSYGVGDADLYLIKTDASGTEQWSQTFGGSSEDMGKSVQQTSDGGYIITGYLTPDGAISTDLYLIKTDASGMELWSQTIGGGFYDYGNSIQQTNDGGYIVAGATSSYGAGGSDVLLIRLDSETGVINLDQPQPLTYSLLHSFPNPFNPTTTISFSLPVAGSVKISVYDIQGNLVTTLADKWLAPGSYQAPFNAGDLSSGIYFARITTGDFTQTQKLVLMK
ncbi:hypothetical protein CEE37_05200 [candidate division LCP-89 bacterium B3_LCP]|uniref:Secretion system C-terminal sorting domain-containing protein n=1 Tax=candidate division LCP-89 bacterium B3_LCP TaxID=2012998 RepID=A0A532V1H5_UNCL8|nr:MAG: hypothetical protein CEE37_05200 [candidate division LCP-89 bacterium B3_LCP]